MRLEDAGITIDLAQRATVWFELAAAEYANMTRGGASAEAALAARICGSSGTSARSDSSQSNWAMGGGGGSRGLYEIVIVVDRRWRAADTEGGLETWATANADQTSADLAWTSWCRCPTARSAASR